MAYIETTIYVQTKSGTEYELDVYVEACVTEGGADRYGSDDPSWVDVEDVRVTSPTTGRNVGRHILESLTATQLAAIDSALIEAHQTHW